MDAVTLALQDLKQRLGLLELEGRRQLESSELTFVLPDPFTPEILRCAIEALENQLSAKPRFHGSYEMQSPPKERRTPISLKAWEGELQQDWDDLGWLNCEFDTAWCRVGLRISLPNEEVRLSAEAPTRDEVNSILNKIQDKLQLEPAGRREALRGERREFFTATPMDVAWLETIVASIRSRVRGSFHFDGSFRMGPARKKEYIRKVLQEWLDDVGRDWEEIVAASAWFGGRKCVVHLRLRPKRQALVIEVQATSPEEVNQVFAELEDGFRLMPAKGDEYDTPRSGASFQMAGWTKDRFITAVNEAVENYVGSHETFEAVSVEGKGAESRVNHDSVASLLERLRSQEQFKELHIIVHGPKGASLGIHVTEGGDHLRLNSSLPVGDFDKLKRLFSPLRLKLSKKSEPDAGGQKPAFFDSTRGKVVMLGLTAVLGIFGWEFIRAAIPRSNLRVSSPTGTNEKPTTLPAGTVLRIEWVREEERWGDKHFVDPGPAHVRILHAGGIEFKKDKLDQPGWELTLPPGEYDVEVTSLDGKERSVASVRIQSKPQ
ncbi:MAG: hypothetical protein O7H41_00705 [Planctomycetota bacterium]|nr:hypothetical protein [Planctomycetota bacterium]